MENSVQSKIPAETEEAAEPLTIDKPGDVMPQTERVTSRLLKKEQKKLLKQTVWFIVGGIALFLGFLFFVLPNFIKIINSVLNTNPLPEEEAMILQAPVLVAPVTATFSAELAIQGISQPGIKNIVIINGTPGPEVTSGDDGAFSATVPLTEGENSFTVYSVDEKGNESSTSKEYKTLMDAKNPDLEVSEPKDNQEYDFKSKLITVSGKTEPTAKIYLNDRFFLPKADGTFSTTFSLNTGENVLKIKVVDEAGNKTEIERKVKLNS
jgi:hypothetical protein